MKEASRLGIGQVRIRSHQSRNGAERKVLFGKYHRRRPSSGQLLRILGIGEEAQAAFVRVQQGIDVPDSDVTVAPQLCIEPAGQLLERQLRTPV
jgi:hypothetical protein